MSSENNIEYINYEMVCRHNKTNKKILYEKHKDNLIFEMIYKQNNENEEEKDKTQKIKEDIDSLLFFNYEKHYKEDKTRLFGKYFVNNNNNKCKILYKNKKYKLKEYLEEIDNNHNNKDIIKIKLSGINNIVNMCEMFYECYQLTSVSDYSSIKNTQKNYEPINSFPNNNQNSTLFFGAKPYIPNLEDEFRTKAGTDWKRMKGLEKIITLYRINYIIKKYREHLNQRKKINSKT